MEWQPIETAPKDETVILLYGRSEWEDYGDTDDAPSIRVGFSQHDKHKNTNRWVIVSDNPYNDYIHATHWMPLPAPPEAAP